MRMVARIPKQSQKSKGIFSLNRPTGPIQSQSQVAPQGGDAGVHHQEACHGYIQVNLIPFLYGFQKFI